MSKPANIPSLTALRGLAAFAVLLHHYEQILPIPGGRALFGKGYLMVDLFFALSGFVMLHVYAGWFRDEMRGSRLVHFMRVRFARIYPLHLFVTVALVGLVAWGRSASALPESASFSAQFGYESLPWVLTLTHAWGPLLTPAWNDPSWSISVEWALYLVFGILALAVARYRDRATMALAAFGVASIFFVVYVAQPSWAEAMASIRPIEPGTMTIATGFALLRGLASFCLGMVAYELFAKRAGETLLGSDALCLVTGLIVVLNTMTGAIPDALMVLLFPLCILQVAYAKGWVSRALASGPLDWLGRISYSVYLTHGPLLLVFLFLITNNTGGILSFLTPWNALLGFVAASLALASATHYFVEVPARRWLRPRSPSSTAERTSPP